MASVNSPHCGPMGNYHCPPFPHNCRQHQHPRARHAFHLAVYAGVKAFSGGEQHTILLKADGTVWGVGYNHYGQLGDGSRSNRNSYVQAKGMSGELEHTIVQATRMRTSILISPSPIVCVRCRVLRTRKCSKLPPMPS